MNLKTFEQFRNALEASSSSDDEEALAAIRQANALLMADNKTWKDLLAGKVTVTMGMFEAHPNVVHSSDRKGRVKVTDEEINMWFDEVRTGRCSASFRSFIESLYTQWCERATLSDAQINALKEAYERATEPRSFSGRRER